ncbi:flagellar protein FlaG [Paenibacillus barengoltzii]|jgi:flagellar protein FlaG|uniref:Flagellar protein FlaG n=1 Tax=Paenibacillus barengoltzii J12 TaxID=935846 RepID=A0ABY1LSI6_9BACL|nr:flagellar protein FlaG [Paenibacillus barengoltzii]SME94892.1 flagellar protein FlaG [Paenibacillus barengoltzii J12]
MKVTNLTSMSLPNSNVKVQQDSDSSISYVGTSYHELQIKSKFETLSVSEKALLDAINKVNKTLEGTPQRFEFKLHHSGELIVKIYNKETNEIIREIPPEKMIELVEKLQQIVVGAIIDEKR